MVEGYARSASVRARSRRSDFLVGLCLAWRGQAGTALRAEAAR